MSMIIENEDHLKSIASRYTGPIALNGKMTSKEEVWVIRRMGAKHVFAHIEGKWIFPTGVGWRNINTDMMFRTKREPDTGDMYLSPVITFPCRLTSAAEIE